MHNTDLISRESHFDRILVDRLELAQAVEVNYISAGEGLERVVIKVFEAFSVRDRIATVNRKAVVGGHIDILYSLLCLGLLNDFFWRR